MDLLRENLELLQNNWTSIQIKVIRPLWNTKFKSMYENIKMDYDDFESLAGIELTMAMRTFVPEKSNVFTFATNVIDRRAMTELRNCTQRDVRKALYVSESVDALDKSVVENIPSETKEKDEMLSEKMLRYLGRLSKLQKQVLFNMTEGYSGEEIRDKLGISAKELSDAYAAIRSYRNVSILY